jgi:hypothetical protein
LKISAKIVDVAALVVFSPMWGTGSPDILHLGSDIGLLTHESNPTCQRSDSTSVKLRQPKALFFPSSGEASLSRGEKLAS